MQEIAFRHLKHTGGANMTNISRAPLEPGSRIIRMRQLTEMISVSRSTIYDWMNPRSPRYNPEFPVPKRLSKSGKSGAIGWIESEVLGWLEIQFQRVPE